MSLRIIQGHVLETLAQIESGSVQTCVTSPPYYMLRSYLPKGHPLKPFEIGSEKTPEEFISNLVAVFREVKRVLRDDGCIWVNMGDSFCSTAPGTMGDGLRQDGILSGVSASCADSRKKLRPETPSGMKPKDMMGIPWMLAFALRADGWYLRSDIIWNKPNPMPESVTDRPTKAHEYIFLLSKNAKYFYDHEAIKEPAIYGDPRKPNAPGQVDARGNGHDRGGGKIRESVKRGGFNGKTNDMAGRESFRAIEDWRNKRTVWTVPPASYSEAHFATFPPDLIKPCILAGSRVGDTILDPFGGSGTSGMVALELGRKAILCELNPDYIELIKNRCNVTPGLALA